MVIGFSFEVTHSWQARPITIGNKQIIGRVDEHTDTEWFVCYQDFIVIKSKKNHDQFQQAALKMNWSNLKFTAMIRISGNRCYTVNGMMKNSVLNVYWTLLDTLEMPRNVHNLSKIVQ